MKRHARTHARHGIPRALAFSVAAATIAGAAIVIAMTTTLSPADRSTDPAADEVRVDGIRTTAGRAVAVDLADGAVVEGRAPRDTETISMAVTVAGVPAGSRTVPLTLTEDGAFFARVDTSVADLLLAGRATAAITFRSASGEALGRTRFELAPEGFNLFTVPLLASVIVLIVAAGYVQWAVRQISEGRKPIRLRYRLALLGMPAGFAVTTVAWAVRGTEPAAMSAVISMLLLVVAGGLAGRAAMPSWRREMVAGTVPADTATA